MAKAPQRLVRLLRPVRGKDPGLLALTVRGKTSFYLFREMASEIGGRAFAISQVGQEPLYHVRVGRPQDMSCECLGFLRHGQCKHLHGLLKLIEQGVI